MPNRVRHFIGIFTLATLAPALGAGCDKSGDCLKACESLQKQSWDACNGDQACQKTVDDTHAACETACKE